MKILDGDSTERANVLCIVNPCNPTGDYMPLDQIKTWINDNVYDGGFVIVGRFIQRPDMIKRYKQCADMIDYRQMNPCNHGTLPTSVKIP
jgi:hypothetical protein